MIRAHLKERQLFGQPEGGWRVTGTRSKSGRDDLYRFNWLKLRSIDLQTSSNMSFSKLKFFAEVILRYLLTGSRISVFSLGKTLLQRAGDFPHQDSTTLRYHILCR